MYGAALFNEIWNIKCTKHDICLRRCLLRIAYVSLYCDDLLWRYGWEHYSGSSVQAIRYGVIDENTIVVSLFKQYVMAENTVVISRMNVYVAHL